MKPKDKIKQQRSGKPVRKNLMQMMNKNFNMTGEYYKIEVEIFLFSTWTCHNDTVGLDN